MRTIVLAGLLFACGGGGAAPTPRPPVARPPVQPAQPPAVTPAKATFPGAPATPSGDQLAWTLDAIVRRHGKPERAEFEAHFHATFLAQVPIERLQKIFEDLGHELTDLAITSVEGGDDELVAHVTSGGQKLKLKVTLALDPASKQISGLLFAGDLETSARPQSFAEALRTIAGLAPKAQFLVAALDKGTCKPLHELAVTDELAIGSTFKLYVLLGLVDRIAAGKATWNDEIAVRDDWKSLPSGVTQNEPPGTKRSLATLAERMISISDNTAADHLLYTVGRKEVEAAVRAAKHAKPALDTPFLSTRELFLFKLGMPAPEVERYLKLPEARRRDYLDKTLAGKAPRADLAGEWKTARRTDKLEWFASSEDLCHVMATLWTRAQAPKGAPLLGVLAKNPGLPIDATVWPYIGFKGGSEPGVINMTYLLRRDDNQWFVVTLGFNAAEGGALDDQQIFNVAAGVIDLVGKAR
jgi:beta-lactamase class A